MDLQQKTNVVLIGNPGVGKSTLLNSLLGDSCQFQAGISYDGTGVTEVLQECEYEGIRYIDTPGLNDLERRKKCAEEITKSLKKSGLYYVCFVLTLEAGRVRPEDKVTVRLVLDSAPQIGTIFYYC